MPAPPCQHEDGCNNEGFSQSAEHSNLWLCAKHYARVLPTLKAKNVLKSMADLSDADKETLLELLKGGKK